MTDITTQALMVAIRAVCADTDRLQDEIGAAEAGGDEDLLASLEDRLLVVSTAETSLKRAYEARLQSEGHLPLYAELLKRPN